jgi:lysozyme
MPKNDRPGRHSFAYAGKCRTPRHRRPSHPMAAQAVHRLVGICSFRTTVVAVISALLVVSSATSALATHRDGPTGVDVSGWQHPYGADIDWEAVRWDAGSFVFIKATEGTWFVNPYFEDDWDDSRSVGMVRGAYHYARPSTRPGSAAEQARHFANIVGDLRGRGELPPVLDLEVTGGLTPAELVQWTRTWLRTVRQLTGRRPIIYTYPAFWRTAMGDTRAFADKHRLWIADWSAETAPRLVGGWDDWTFWQHSSRGSVSGISARVDLDRYNGTHRELRQLANMW